MLKVISFTLSTLFTASSIGIVTKDSISPGLLPGKTVETKTIGILICGFNVLGKTKNEFMPIPKTKTKIKRTSLGLEKYLAIKVVLEIFSFIHNLNFVTGNNIPVDYNFVFYT